jgi:hypothetical protein
MDSRTEALLGPERKPDPAEADALERRVEEEDFRLRVKLAGYAAPLVIFFLIILYPLAGPWLSRWPTSWSLTTWLYLNLPLVAAAFLILRHGRMPLGRGRFLTGRPARRAAAGMLALSLVLSFGLGWLQALWDWVAAGR